MNANRMLTGWTTLLLSAALAICAPQAGAQETQDASTVTVTGNVVDQTTGEPIPGVVIVVEGLDMSFFTESDGKFTIADVPRGTYTLQLIHKDYQRLDGDLGIDRPGEFFLRMTPFEDPNEGMVTGILGVVQDGVNGRPIPEVVVNVPGAGQVARTDADGRFALPNLAPGRHEVAFSHLGYRQRSETIEVQPGHATRMQVVLAVDAIALDPIEVTVDRLDRALEDAGFYQRREDGWGYFVDREDIDRWNPITVTDALMRFHGVAITSGSGGPFQRQLRLRGRGAGACTPRVYLDGTLLSGLQTFSVNDIVDPMSVAGIEVYRGVAGIPARYSGLGTSCGVVLIWLRRGG